MAVWTDLGPDEELSKKSEITSAGSTELITGGLEASNVDLATEISDNDYHPARLSGQYPHHYRD